MAFKITIKNPNGVNTVATFKSMEEAAKFAREVAAVPVATVAMPSSTHSTNNGLDLDNLTTKELVDAHNRAIRTMFSNIVEINNHSVVKTPRTVSSLSTCWGAFEGMDTTEFCKVVDALCKNGILKRGKRGLDAAIFSRICSKSRIAHARAFHLKHKDCSGTK
jgi:serine protease inhibitor